jgi:hypothetical protein
MRHQMVPVQCPSGRRFCGLLHVSPWYLLWGLILGWLLLGDSRGQETGSSGKPWDTLYTGEEATGEHVLGLWQFLPGQETKDNSGKGHELKLRGNSRFAAGGKFGNCLESFPADRENDRPHGAVVKNSPLLSPSGAFTLEMWICAKPEVERSSLAFLLDKKYYHYESPLPQANWDYCWYIRRVRPGQFQMLASLGFGKDSETFSSRAFTLTAGKWYHIAFCYDGRGTGRFLLDGEVIGRQVHPGRAEITPGKHDLVIGDRVGSIHAGFPGFIDQVRICRGIPPRFGTVSVGFAPGSRRVWQRMEENARLNLEVANDFSEALEKVVLVVTHPLGRQEVLLGNLSAGEVRTLPVSVDTRLRPGRYSLSAKLTAHRVEPNRSGKNPVTISRQFEFQIVPRPLPDQMPVILWGSGDPEEVAAIGFTHQFVSLVDYNRIWQAGEVTEPLSESRKADVIEELDNLLARGLRAAVHLHPCSWLMSQESLREKFQRIDRQGKPYTTANPCGLFPEVQRFAYHVGVSVGKLFGGHPALEAALIHSEVRDSTNLCFHDHDREAVQQKLGLDFPQEVTSKWGVRYSTIKNFPPERVLPAEDPLLGFYRWFWKEGDGWNELHSAVHRGLKETARKKIWTWFDPAVRVPSIWGSGGQVDVISQWTYTYPDPIKIGQATDELLAMAEGSGQQVMKMTQIIWYRSQTAPVLPEDPARRAAWENQIPDAQFITIAPDHLREALWVKLSRPIKGIMYHGWASLVEAPHGSYRYTNPQTKEVLQQLVREVVRPLGPAFLLLEDPPADIALLESFTSQIFAGRGTYGWGRSWEADVHLILQWARLQPKILYEEAVLRDGLSGYRILVLPGCDVLPRSIVEAIRKFQASGGIVIGDDNLCPAIQADYVLKTRRRTEKADADKAALQAQAEELRQWLKSCYSWPVDSSEPDVVLRRRVAGEAEYIFAINDRRTYGDYVGHHGRVMETGLPCSATVRLRRQGGVVYDLVARRQVVATCEPEGLRWEVQLGPGEGKVFLVCPREIGGLQLANTPEAPVGGRVCIDVRVVDREGRDFPAVVPIYLGIIDPAGKESEGTGFYPACQGKLSARYEVAPNDLAGKWTIRVQELASGQELVGHFVVR